MKRTYSRRVGESIGPGPCQKERLFERSSSPGNNSSCLRGSPLSFLFFFSLLRPLFFLFGDAAVGDDFVSTNWRPTTF